MGRSSPGQGRVRAALGTPEQCQPRLQAVSLLWGSNPSTTGWPQSTAQMATRTAQPEKQSGERAVVSVLLIACSCPDYLVYLKEILPGRLTTH